MDENNEYRVGDRVTMRLRGKKQTWIAEFNWEGKHCRQTLRTRNFKIARRRAVQLDSQLQQGLNPLQHRVLKRTFIQQTTDDFLEFQKTERKRAKTRTKYNGLFKKLVAFAQTQGVTQTSEIDLSLIDRFRSARAKEVGDRSLHNDGVMLKFFFSWCVERQLMSKNPLGTRKFRRPKSKPRGGPTLEQIDLILADAPPILAPVIAMLAFTGRRSGDCQRLQPPDVDFANNLIHVVSRPGLETKTGNSTDVPIHPRLKRILAKVPKGKKWFFTSPVSRQFPNGDHHFNMKRANEDFKKILTKIGIPAGKKNNGFTLHSLRSFFKTHAINAGIPREVVDLWQDHAGDRRPTAGDGYYLCSPAKSQEFMKRVPFGDGKPAADAGDKEVKR
jgi:integrase